MFQYIRETIEKESHEPTANFIVRWSRLISGLLVIILKIPKKVWAPTLAFFMLSGFPVSEGKLSMQHPATGGPDEGQLSGGWFQYNTVLTSDGSFRANSAVFPAWVEYATDTLMLAEDFELVPLGKDSVNLEFSRRDVWRFILGDNSYTANGFSYQSNDGSWSKNRRDYYKNCSFALGEPINVKIQESYLEREDKYRIDFDIYCKNAKDQFRYEFTPIYNWKENKNFYLGFIGTSSEVYLVKPAVSERLLE